MSKLADFKKNLKERAVVDPPGAINTFQEALTNERLKNTCLSLAGRWSDVMDHNRDGILSTQEFFQEKNKIRQAILSLVSQIEEEDLKDRLDPLRILIICQDEAQSEHLDYYFRCYGYDNILAEVRSSYEVPKGYNVVVFDNSKVKGEDREGGEKVYSEEEEDRILLMKEYLEQTEKDLGTHAILFIHFGEYLKLLEKHRDKATAANSLLSLYARVKEVDEYRQKVGLLPSQ